MVKDKVQRVANFHNETVMSFVEFMGATGVDDLSKIKKTSCLQTCESTEIKTFAEIYPVVGIGEYI